MLTDEQKLKKRCNLPYGNGGPRNGAYGCVNRILGKPQYQKDRKKADGSPLFPECF